VQVQLAGSGGPTGAVCLGPYQWDPQTGAPRTLAQHAARVVCRQLGFSGASLAVYNSSALYNTSGNSGKAGSGTAVGLLAPPPMVVQVLECTGREARLQDCALSAVVNLWTAGHTCLDNYPGQPSCPSSIHIDDCHICNALSVICTSDAGHGAPAGGGSQQVGSCPCHTLPCPALPCHAMPCHAMLCSAGAYAALLCSALLFSVSFFAVCTAGGWAGYSAQHARLPPLPCRWLPFGGC